MATPASPDLVSLSAGAFAEVFPFHFAFDRELTVLQSGPSLRRICPEFAPGESLGRLLLVERPAGVASFAAFEANQKQLFVLRRRAGELRLRGQMLVLRPGVIAFLGAPWLSDTADIARLGLSLGDFALHDPALDMLQLLQSQAGALSELQDLTDRLSRQRRELVSANGELARRFEELKKAERDREELFGLLDSTLESTADGILVAAPDGRTIRFNRRFLELWQISQDVAERNDPGALRAHVLPLVANPDEFTDRILWLYAHPGEESFDMIHLRDGRVFERYSRPRIQAGSTTGRVWSYRDVTERWQTQEALRFSEERYRVVAEAASDGILTIDTESRILYANAMAERIFGYPRAQLLSMSLTDLMPPEARAPHAAGLRRYLQSGQRKLNWRSVQVPGLRADGVKIPLELSFGESRTSGNHWFTSIVRDVTERSEWEDRLQRAREAAEAASKAKTEFLASISHEIRTPLNAIVGMSELLAETPLTPEQSEYQATVRASAESLLHLINDLLDVSRIEAGQTNIYPEPFDPAEVCEESIQISQSRARQKQLGLYFVSTPALPPPVLGDRNRVRQILMNLLSNALKFTRRGHVVLRLTWSIRLGEIVTLQFSVTDTGPGIAAEDQSRIFEKFVQLDGSAHRFSGGAGLGLAICRALAEAMHGQISLESAPGAGSTFRFSLDLPRAPRRPSADLLFLQRCASLDGVLLSASADAAILQTALGAWGIRVRRFLNFEDACSALRQPPCNLFVCDSSVSMEEAAGAVRLARGAGIPVLLLPAQGASFYPVAGSFESCEVVEQPALPSRLEAALRRLLHLAPRESSGRSLAVPSQPQTGLRLLVAEDNPENQKLTRRVLEAAGYQVDLAADGEAAADMAAAFRYDGILMDLQMPVMDGFMAAQAIRRAEAAAALPRVPIIALTAHALAEYRERAMEAGMDSYLIKPISRDYLLSALRRTLDHRPLVLVVDDDTASLRLLENRLHSARHWRVSTAGGAAEAFRTFTACNVALVLMDLELGEDSGLELTARMLASSRRPVPVVAVTGHTGAEAERRILSAGCVGLLEKPVSREALLAVVRRYAPPGISADPEKVLVDPLLADLIPSFLDGMRSAAAEMETLAGRDELEAVRRIAHRVKGAGGGYNFHTVTLLGRSIESAAAHGDATAARDAVAQLTEYLSFVEWSVPGEVSASFSPPV